MRTEFIEDTTFKAVNFTEREQLADEYESCTFMNCIFSNADFRTSYNYSINPETNRIKKAKFSIQGIVGLLDGYDIVVD